MTCVFQDREKRGQMDLEAAESAIRHSMHQIGGMFLERLVNADKGGHRGARMA